MNPFTLVFFASFLAASNQLATTNSVNRWEMLSNMLNVKAAQPPPQRKIQRATCSCTNQTCHKPSCRVSVTFFNLNLPLEIVESNFHSRNFHVTCFCSIRQITNHDNQNPLSDTGAQIVKMSFQPSPSYDFTMLAQDPPLAITCTIETPVPVRRQ